ncbi:jg20689, partial [Pararge aegeria aegeria]
AGRAKGQRGYVPIKDLKSKIDRKNLNLPTYKDVSPKDLAFRYNFGRTKQIDYVMMLTLQRISETCEEVPKICLVWSIRIEEIINGTMQILLLFAEYSKLSLIFMTSFGMRVCQELVRRSEGIVG